MKLLSRANAATKDFLCLVGRVTNTLNTQPRKLPKKKLLVKMRLKTLSSQTRDRIEDRLEGPEGEMR